MADKDSCGGCPRLPVWSSPTVLVDGEPAGTAKSTTPALSRHWLRGSLPSDEHESALRLSSPIRRTRTQVRDLQTHRDGNLVEATLESCGPRTWKCHVTALQHYPRANRKEFILAKVDLTK